MTSRINYNQPLKSVRTIRSLSIEQYDPQKAFVDDPARPSDADLMHDAGVAFSWEKEPGRSKVEQERIEAVSPVELKPPPQALAPPPSSKVPSVEVPKSPPPAGTEPNGRSFHHLLDNSKFTPPEAQAAALIARSQPTTIANHQLPPKPTQSKPPLAGPVQPSGDKPPQPRRSRSVSVSQSGHLNISSPHLSRNGAHDQPPDRRMARKGGGQGVHVGKERHHQSSLALTLHTVTHDEGSTPLSDPNGGGTLIRRSRDEGVALHSTLRGNQDYLSARLRQSQSPALGVKDFYQSGRHTPLSSIPNSRNLTRPNSCMPTRPNSASASEAGSHSDDGDQTDLGDAFSQMNAKEDGRCQVSIIDGDHLELTSRRTDPRARDFIMERFLPAAKAMVNETADDLDRRSSQETPLVSPTRKNGRSSLLGRSRFAFKDRFAEEEEEEQEDVDPTDVLFKCKFPWQMGALRSTMPLIAAVTDSGSAEQSPSPSFANNKYSPSPTASFENRKEPSPRPVFDGQHDDAASIYAESDGSATPKRDNVCSFEERGLPPKSRTKSSPSLLTSRGQLYSREPDSHDSNRNLSVIGESANGDYGSEHSGRSNVFSGRGSPGVPKDRLNETATQGDFDNRSGPPGNLGRRSPDMVYSGSLGALLRTTQQQRRDLGRNSEAAIQAAVENVQEPIPPSSILNHHRNGPARAAAMSSAYGAKHSSTKPTYPGNGVLPDESNSYPRHVKLNLIRQQEAEPSGGSGRSLESLNDEVWESAREFPAAAESYDRSGKLLLTSSDSSLPESANEGLHSSGWPLAKIQPLYARTPSSDSKDASFSSVSERSLRSPTNLAMTVQASTEKYSPVSVLQPPLPKSPSESWLFKVKPLAPPSTGTNWQRPKPKKFLDYSSPDDSMDVKWEALVKSENAQLRSKMAQNGQSASEPPLKDRLPVGLSVVG